MGPAAMISTACSLVYCTVASAPVVTHKLERVVEPTAFTPPRTFWVLVANPTGISAPLLHPCAVARLAGASVPVAV